MAQDTRRGSARYYDACPFLPNDVAFYRTRMPSPDARVLELGCGTGRILVPLAGSCGFIQGIELSAAMLDVCRAKMRAAGLDPGRARVELGDMTSPTLALGPTFDLVLAPYRVFQNLETDAQAQAALRTIGRHLAPGGTAILNTFHPVHDPDTMRRVWCRTEEKLEWEVTRGDERITCHDLRPRLDPDRLVLYPQFIYRRYVRNEQIDEFVHDFAMRCWYPDQLTALIESHGFRVVDRWGGYDGEAYGAGGELVVEFAAPE